MLLHWTFIAFGVFASCYGTFINYKPGYEYIYDFSSTLDVKTLHKLDAAGEVGLTNIWNDSDVQELVLSVHKFQLRKLDVNGTAASETISHHLDFSQWFSFHISRRGEILKVTYPKTDHKDVVAIKNGIVSFLAAKLHHPHEVANINRNKENKDTWYYSAEDEHKHGLVSANYKGTKSATGHHFVKTANISDPKLPTGKTTSTKTINLHNELDTIHSVEMEDNFHMHFDSPNSFNPYYGMRDVTPVSPFVKPDYFNAGYTYFEIQVQMSLDHRINISLRQLKRHLKRLGLRRRSVWHPNIVQSAIQAEILNSGANLGCRAMARRLLTRHGISVGRPVLWVMK